MSVNKFRSSKKFHVTGGTQRLTRVVGVALAKELVFTSRILDGNEAARMGVVNHSVEQNDAGDAAYHRAIELAKEITPNVSRGCCCHDRVVVKSPKQRLETYCFCSVSYY
jgi:enoyl-CoA hydratase/carnithine racemase